MCYLRSNRRYINIGLGKVVVKLAITWISAAVKFDHCAAINFKLWLHHSEKGAQSICMYNTFSIYHIHIAQYLVQSLYDDKCSKAFNIKDYLHSHQQLFKLTLRSGTNPPKLHRIILKLTLTATLHKYNYTCTVSFQTTMPRCYTHSNILARTIRFS